MMSKILKASRTCSTQTQKKSKLKPQRNESDDDSKSSSSTIYCNDWINSLPKDLILRKYPSMNFSVDSIDAEMSENTSNSNSSSTLYSWSGCDNSKISLTMNLSTSEPEVIFRSESDETLCNDNDVTNLSIVSMNISQTTVGSTIQVENNIDVVPIPTSPKVLCFNSTQESSKLVNSQQQLSSSSCQNSNSAYDNNDNPNDILLVSKEITDNRILVIDPTGIETTSSGNDDDARTTTTTVHATNTSMIQESQSNSQESDNYEVANGQNQNQNNNGLDDDTICNNNILVDEISERDNNETETQNDNEEEENGSILDETIVPNYETKNMDENKDDKNEANNVENKGDNENNDEADETESYDVDSENSGEETLRTWEPQLESFIKRKKSQRFKSFKIYNDEENQSKATSSLQASAEQNPNGNGNNTPSTTNGKTSGHSAYFTSVEYISSIPKEQFKHMRSLKRSLKRKYPNGLPNDLSCTFSSGSDDSSLSLLTESEVERKIIGYNYTTKAFYFPNTHVNRIVDRDE